MGSSASVLPAGRYQIPRPPRRLRRVLRGRAPRVEVVLVDVRGRDRTVVVQDLLTADGATISASFVVQSGSSTPGGGPRGQELRGAALRRGPDRRPAVLRGLSLEEVLGGRDEIGEEMLRQVRESAAAYGLEVSALDFKDLILPEELRKVLNRAVLARRLRQAELADRAEVERVRAGGRGSGRLSTDRDAEPTPRRGRRPDHRPGRGFDRDRGPSTDRDPGATGSSASARSASVADQPSSLHERLRSVHGVRSPIAHARNFLTTRFPDLVFTRAYQVGPGDEAYQGAARWDLRSERSASPVFRAWKSRAATTRVASDLPLLRPAGRPRPVDSRHLDDRRRTSPRRPPRLRTPARPRTDLGARPMPGRIGRFVIREPLGEGGYGQVFRAYDPHLDRDVALKVLKPNRLGEKALERFYREARAAARLDHPNIVGLHDAGRDEGRCWIAYQLVPGRTLSMIRDLDRPSIDESVRIVRDLALALDHAHGRGVFHRDLKPANVLIDDSGRARLTDFGLARRGDLDSDLTREGTVLGHPPVHEPRGRRRPGPRGRRPERRLQPGRDPLRADLRPEAGRRPQQRPALAVDPDRHARRPPARSTGPIPAALDRICMKALAFDPDARYPDARSLADALDRLPPGPADATPGRSARREARRRDSAVGLIVAASVLCLLLGMSLHIAAREAPARASHAVAPERSSPIDRRRRPGRRSFDPASPRPVAGRLVSRPPSRSIPAADPHRPEAETRVAAVRPPSPLAEPVVWIHGNRLRWKVHRRGMPAREPDHQVEADRRWAMPDAILAGYIPCKACLKLLAVGQVLRPSRATSELRPPPAELDPAAPARSILSDSGEALAGGLRPGRRPWRVVGRMGGWALGISGAIVALVAAAWASGASCGAGPCSASWSGAWSRSARGGRSGRRDTGPGPVGRLARTFDAVVPGLQERVGRLGRDVEQLRVVLGGMAEGVIAIDSRRRLLFANESADRLFGLGPQAVGRLVPELIRSPQIQEAVDATLAGPETYRGEIVLPGREVLPRSIPRVLAVHGTLLPGSPPTGAVLVFHDVTELRRLERMRQDFVANVSHELKTPLASIKAYTETLLDWALHDEEVNVRFLHRIEEQADRLNQLILDLLSLARLESGQEVFQHGPLAVSAVVEACIETHRGRAEAKGLDLRLDLGPVDDSTLVVADEEAVHQILDNLIDNAIKYTPEGGWVRVACRLDRRRRRARGRRLRDRHPPRRPAPRLRAVLPGRQGPEPRAGRDRAGPLDRQAPGPVDRRPGRRRQPGRRGDPVHRPAAPRYRPAPEILGEIGRELHENFTMTW